jgi:hypothetical protein
MQLTRHDLRYVAQRLPRDIRDLLKQHGPRLMVGGGFIRASIAGEVPSDIDLFGDDAEWLLNVAHALVASRMGARMHRTKNAITVITPDRMPVQFITRWTFKTAKDCVASFDFTVCQAVIYRRKTAQGEWQSEIGARFYQDLASRKLYYTSPKREEEAGGSMLRVIKYVKRGYSIQVDSLGRVIARLALDKHVTEAALVDCVKTGAAREQYIGLAISDLLREVDPLLVIDGFEVVDDHDPIEGEPA